MSAVPYPSHGGSPDNRVFHYAIALSIALHAVLLFAVPGLRDGKRGPEAPGVLVAHIVAPQSPAAQAPPQIEPVVPPVEPPKPRVEPPPEPPPVRTPSPIAKAAPPLDPAPRPPAPAAAASSAPAATAPGPAVSAEIQSGAAGDLDLGSLRTYERQLSFAAQRYRTYPRVAMDNGWEGTVELVIVIGADGLIRSMSVKTSSGRGVLDQEAMDMFRKAKRLVPIPPALVGREFTTVRTVVFELKERG